MPACPACEKNTQADALACPHCGISLHPDAPTRAHSDKPGGASTAVVAVLVGGGIVLLLMVLLFGVGLFAFRSASVPLAAPPGGFTITVPAATTIVVEEPADPDPPKTPEATNSIDQKPQPEDTDPKPC